jgi:molecular chaperone GrpE
MSESSQAQDEQGTAGAGQPTHQTHTEQSGGATGGGELEALRAERDELAAQLARARADYQNLRKRTQLDVDNAVRRSLENLLQNLFVVVDNLDFALRVEPRSEDARQLAHGVDLTRMQLLHALTQEGASPIPDSKTFDTKLHEAVSTAPSAEHAPGTILHVLRRGWTWRGTVLRPAHVQVAAAPATEPTTPGSPARDSSHKGA